MPINVPNTGPARIAVGNPITAPRIITQPKSAPKILATATGPGVGGIKVCVTASPASNGIPKCKTDFLHSFANV